MNLLQPRLVVFLSESKDGSQADPDCLPGSANKAIRLCNYILTTNLTEEDTTAAPPATDETQPATVEEEPVPPCPEGQALDEELGLCVLEEPEAAEEQQESQPERDQQQSEDEGDQRQSEEGDGSEDNNN
jgi:hypothetical protein